MVVKNMEASLEVPTATSVRAVPAKLLADNRLVINNQLRRTRGGKISFTHLIGFAVVRALAEFPVMNRHFTEIDDRPTVVAPDHVNLGLAIDLPGKNGQRSLVVVSIKGCESMNFAQFWSAYEAIVHKARTGALKGDDFTGTTLTLTSPGTLGTNHLVPRLMQGQGAIIGVGAMEYHREVIGDPRHCSQDRSASNVSRILLCVGKIYWELAAARDRHKLDDTAIVRIEQLYPLPDRPLAAVLERYPNAKDARWVQEEPANQGPWPYLGLDLPEKLPERLSGLKRVSRRRMAAPAPGSSKVHEIEQEAIIDKALGPVRD